MKAHERRMQSNWKELKTNERNVNENERKWKGNERKQNECTSHAHKKYVNAMSYQKFADIGLDGNPKNFWKSSPQSDDKIFFWGAGNFRKSYFFLRFSCPWPENGKIL